MTLFAFFFMATGRAVFGRTDLLALAPKLLNQFRAQQIAMIFITHDLGSVAATS